MGLTLVKRGQKLAGLTEDQKLSLKKLEAEVSFYIARTRLEDAQVEIEEALTQLRIAAKSESHNARAANQMLMTVEPAAKGLSDSLRNAVHGLSDPPAVTPPPAVAPAPVPTETPPPTTPPAGAPEAKVEPKPESGSPPPP
jgi:hypothetical protein